MLIRRLIEFLTPTQCLECSREGDILCLECVQILSESEVMVGEVGAGLAGVMVGARYEGSMKELILQLKFYRLRSAAEAAATLVWLAIPEDFTTDVVTSVPVSGARYRERGYNQSELVARRLAAQLGLPYRALLGRATSTHQMGLDRQSRLEQIRGAFYPMKPLEGQRVLIVDDVVTTGATLYECAASLRMAGAGLVWGAVVAKKR